MHQVLTHVFLKVLVVKCGGLARLYLEVQSLDIQLSSLKHQLPVMSCQRLPGQMRVDKSPAMAAKLIVARRSPSTSPTCLCAANSSRAATSSCRRIYQILSGW